MVPSSSPADFAPRAFFRPSVIPHACASVAPSAFGLDFAGSLRGSDPIALPLQRHFCGKIYC